MTLKQQLSAAWRAFGAPRRLGPDTLKWLGLYATLLGAVFGFTAWNLVEHQGDIQRGLLQFFLPEGWMFAGEFLLDRYWAAQAQAVLISLTLGGALMMSSVLLFPVKEQLGAAFEREAGLTGKPIHEFPLWYQAWEEIKLFLLYTALSFLIIRLGHTPDPTRRLWAKGLGYAVLALTFSVDFIAPLLQRHRLRYSQILKVMVRRPGIFLPFGCLFALPPAIIGAALAKHGGPGWSLPELLALGLGLNLVALLGAVLVGNALGAALLDESERTPVSSLPTQAITWLLVVGTLTVNLYIFGKVGHAALQISPVLKCEYSVDPSTLDVDLPGLFDRTLTVSAEVRVHNPTDREVSLVDHRIELRHAGALMATSTLPTMHVRGGGTRTERLSFSIRAEGGLLNKGMQLAQRASSGGWEDALGTLADAGQAAIDPAYYAITLIIPTGLEEFPVFLYAGERSAAPQN